MTSYSNDSYVFSSYNNENDALTCDNTCNTLENGKYRRSLENTKGVYYKNDFSNLNYNDDTKLRIQNDHYENMSSGDITTNYTVKLNENLMYDTSHINAIHQEASMTGFLENIQDTSGECSDDYSVNFSNAYNDMEYRSAFDDRYYSKMLPHTSLKRNSSMSEGMYTTSGSSGCGSTQQCHQSFIASQKQTPAPAVSRSRMLPHPKTPAGGVVANDYARVKRQRPLQQINGFEFEGFINSASKQIGSGNMRILPQPHTPLSKTIESNSMLIQHQNFKDTMKRTTIANPNNFYAMKTINQEQDSRFNNSRNYDTYSWTENSISCKSSTFDIDNISPLQNQLRPHTSMAPFNIYEADDPEYGESGYYADDNLSTYSDTPIALSATSGKSSTAAQQKLQQQRRLSLMMAMTTASVIASGETRIAPNKKKQQTKASPPITKGAENRETIRITKYSDENSFKYGSTNGFNTNKCSFISNNVSMPLPITNTTNRASQSLSATTSCTLPTVVATEAQTIPTTSIIVTTTTITDSPVARPIRSRKLPKCLPINIECKKNNESDKTAELTANTSISNSKILPKLPITIKKNNNLLEKQPAQVLPDRTANSPIPTYNIVTSSTNFPTYSDVSKDNSAMTGSSRNSNITDLPNVFTSDLSNNNNQTINLYQKADNLTIKLYNSVDDHIPVVPSSITTTTDLISIYASSSSQPTTYISSNKTIDSSPFSPTLHQYVAPSNDDHQSYLKYCSLSTEANFSADNFSTSISKITPTASDDSNVQSTIITKTPSYLVCNSLSPSIEVTKSSNEISHVPENMNKNLNMESQSKIIMTDYSAYINSLTTVASSPSTPLKVFSENVTESLVTLQASPKLTSTLTSTYYDSLSSSKITNTTDADRPTNISLEKPNFYDISVLPTKFSTADILANNSIENSSSNPPHTTLSPVSDVLSDGTFSESYAEYLKKFELPELPPLLTFSDTVKDDKNDQVNSFPIENHQDKLSLISTNITTETNTNNMSNKKEIRQSQELPNITDFLNEDYTIGKHDFLNEYKILEENKKNMSIFCESVSSTVSQQSSSNKTLESVINPPFIFQSVESTSALPTPLLTTTTKEGNSSYEFFVEYSKNKNDDSTNINDTTFVPTTSDTQSLSNETYDIVTTSDKLLASTSISSAFDDSFYDSFKVDLDTLTGAITSDEQSSITTTITTTAMKNLLTDDPTVMTTVDEVFPTTNYSTSILNDYNENTLPTQTTTNNQGGYYRPSNVKTSISSITFPSEEMVKGVTISTSAASKTTSLIGGLSKGIKGSILDGVLTGVSGTGTANNNQQQPTAKKGFGFNLASKLVPGVGGLLSSASANKIIGKQNPVSTFSSPTTTALPVSAYTTKGTIISESVGSSPVYVRNSNDSLSHATDDETYTSIYENRDEFCDVDYNNQYQHKYEFGIQNTDNSGTAVDDEYGGGIYSEYNMANVYAVESCSTTTVTTEILTINQEIGGVISDSDSKGPIGSTVLSTIKNVAISQEPQQSTQQKKKIESLESKSVGMFGSFLGKAAAAVQSATQVVNQGAAAIVQQQKTAVNSTINLPTTTTTTGITTTSSIGLNNAYSSQQQQEENSSLYSLQTYSSLTTTAGGDYENSNMVAVYNHDTIVGMNTNNYYSNGNQSQPPTITTTKMLPTVPAVGKKLPNITNGSKSGIGYLIKQQPTEIYDDEEFEEVKSSNYLFNNQQNDYYNDSDPSKELMTKTTHVNGYEQHHNFGDPVGSNSGGYDYREDYFDEEDEYKYLEREAEAEQERLYIQQQKQQKLLIQHQKQSSSLEYIEDSQFDIEENVAHDGFFNDDNYPSEDSGNYLDESSSGSVGEMVIKMQRGPNTTTSSSTMLPETEPQTSATKSSASISTTAGLHHQIKKQDSVIMEEDDKLMENNLNDLLDSPLSRNNAKTAFRRKSSEAIIDNNISIDEDISDQLADLTPNITRKKKVLIRGETEEVVSGHMHIMKRQKQPEVTAKQRWHWAYNKIIMQLNVSKIHYFS